jgi:hypothetical protein
MAEILSSKRNYRAQAQPVFEDMRRLLERIRDDEDRRTSMSAEFGARDRRNSGPRCLRAVLRLVGADPIRSVSQEKSELISHKPRSFHSGSKALAEVGAHWPRHGGLHRALGSHRHNLARFRLYPARLHRGDGVTPKSKEGSKHMERLEAARSLRACALRLRAVAATEPRLSAELVKMAEEIEEDAARMERSFRDSPPRPANDENVA